MGLKTGCESKKRERIETRSLKRKITFEGLITKTQARHLSNTLLIIATHWPPPSVEVNGDISSVEIKNFTFFFNKSKGCFLCSQVVVSLKLIGFLFSMVVRLIAREISPAQPLLLNPFCKTHLNGLGDKTKHVALIASSLIRKTTKLSLGFHTQENFLLLLIDVTSLFEWFNFIFDVKHFFEQ